jgi:hypothetical protein
MIFQILRALWPAMFGEIGWSSKGNDAQRVQSARYQSLVDRFSDPHGNIETFSKQIDLFVGCS